MKCTSMAETLRGTVKSASVFTRPWLASSAIAPTRSRSRSTTGVTESHTIFWALTRNALYVLNAGS